MRSTRRHARKLWTCVLPLFLGSTSPLFAQQDKPDDTRPPATAPAPAGADLGESARKIMQLTNEARGEQERSALTLSPELEKAAQGLADYMAKTGKFSHEADDRTPSQRAEAEKYDPCLVAENIARVVRSEAFDTAELAQWFVEGWIDSPPHQKNLLDPASTEIGVGVARSAETGQYFAVQLFGRPRSAAIRFSLVNPTETEVRYTLGEETYDLPPGVTRTHEECRPQTLTFLGPAGKAADADDNQEAQQDDATPAAQTFQPERGQRFTVERAGEEFRLTVERDEPQATTPPEAP